MELTIEVFHDGCRRGIRVLLGDSRRLGPDFLHLVSRLFPVRLDIRLRKVEVTPHLRREHSSVVSVGGNHGVEVVLIERTGRSGRRFIREPGGEVHREHRVRGRRGGSRLRQCLSVSGRRDCDSVDVGGRLGDQGGGEDNVGSGGDGRRRGGTCRERKVVGYRCGGDGGTIEGGKGGGWGNKPAACVLPGAAESGGVAGIEAGGGRGLGKEGEGDGG